MRNLLFANETVENKYFNFEPLCDQVVTITV